VNGAAIAFPQPNTIDVSRERAHRGLYAAKLTITAGADGAQGNAGLSRADGLSTEGYYSAWYYLPTKVDVGTYWVIFKFRLRAAAADASTEGELYDLNLTNLDTGEMSLRLYDHRSGDVPLLANAPPPVVPVGAWFQIEGFYRNAPDATGRLTLWLNGDLIVDVTNQPMSTNGWVAWDACSDAVGLTPATAVLYIDDCAVSRTRVGPTGLLDGP
jgi:hypothetical protein